MKKILFSFIAAAALFTSCKDDENKFLPQMSGSPYEILCVSSDNIWNSCIGDTVRNFFGREMVVLPQPEKEFKVLRIPNNKFERHFAKHRNVIQFLISSNIDQTDIYYKEEFRSKTQQYFILQAKDTLSMLNLFLKNKENIRKILLKAEEKRLLKSFKEFPEKKVINYFRDSLKLDICLPKDFRLNKVQKDYVWTSYETTEYSQGIILFKDSLQDATQFNLQIALDRVNDMINKTIPGPIDSTWMALDMEAPYITEVFMAHNRYYTMQTRGLWEVENDFMGGPYVLNIMLDKSHSQIIYAMAYVYNPNKPKNKMVRRVEAAINSIQPAK